MTTELDSSSALLHLPGAKFDSGKAPVMRGVIQYFPRALEQVAKVSAAGAAKYTWNGWETVLDGPSRYSDALARHLLAEVIEGPVDDGPGGTGCLHAAQVAWNALARLELLLREMEKAAADPVDRSEYPEVPIQDSGL